ncbi:hypothetical protein AX16_002851 [Volvariella volvacea WC 439]|nr:hypothetical protein AX16_002851 [Volvariella volvacea WC 439]
MTQNLLSSTVASVTNHFRPHRAEAIQRVRSNVLCLVSTLALSNLLPVVPSLQYAVLMVLKKSGPDKWGNDWVFKWCCILEVTFATIFVFNICEAALALKYPRASSDSASAQAKAKVAPATGTPSSTTRPFKSLSPFTSPQPQKPFAYSLSSSLGASTSPLSSSISTALGSSSKSRLPYGNLFSSKGYPMTPQSTPSRELKYTIPPGAFSASTSSTGSASSIYNSPSPLVSAYRGRHSVHRGHALDESYLGRIVARGDFDDE